MNLLSQHSQLIELQNVIGKDSNHAASILVYGRKGSGKKQLVIEFVKTLFCSQSDFFCDSCEACIGISNIRHPEVKMIARNEGSQSISISDIRELIHFVRLKRSTNVHSKIAIIHEAQFLFASTANAMLKTLEEPPAGVIIFLIADTPHNLPQTITSRCMPLFISLDQSNYSHDNSAAEFISASPNRRMMIIDEMIKKIKQDEALKSFQVSEKLNNFIESLEFTVRSELVARAQGVQSLETLANISERKLISAVGWIQDLRYTIRMNINAQTALEQFALRLS